MSASLLVIATVGNELTVIVTLDAVVLSVTDTQFSFEVISTLITSSWTNEVDVYVASVALLISIAPLNHLYTGIKPPLIGVAVKVTEVPAQIVLDDADKLTEAVVLELTIILISPDVAGFPVAHVAFDVICTVIASLCAKVVDV